MKIMYICGMYVPSHGGAEMSMYSLLKSLQDKLDWDVKVVTDEKYELTRSNNRFNKIKISAIPHHGRESRIDLEILQFKPDIIVTQLMWSDVALKLAKKHSIPSIMRVCKVPLELNLSESSEYSPSAIISTSNSVKDYVLSHWNRDSIIIKPLVKLKDYIIEKKGFNPSKNDLIFMFNPLQRKGGLIFKEIAKRMPLEKFGTVLGWSSLKDGKNSKSFSVEYIKRITESEGSVFDGSLPSYVNFNDCGNVTLFKPEDDSRKLYEKIKILLIPSQWEEAFGRVAIEAMANGIPVIASNVGGLKDSVGNGGILLEKDNLDAWVNEIKKLNSDEPYYQDISEREKKFVKSSYSQDKILDEFKAIVKRLTEQ